METKRGSRRSFSELIKTIDEVIPRVFTRKGPPFDALYSCFIASVSRFKHRGFREEQEVRILLSPMSQAAIDRYKKDSPERFAKNNRKVRKEVHFREPFTPYIRLFDAKRVTLPILKIIVGPHADKQARQERLQRFLELKGMQLEVACSQTPFAQYR